MEASGYLECEKRRMAFLLRLLHADLFTERELRDRKPGGHDTTSFKENDPLSLERKDA